jgi:hypothetical protein
MKPNMTDPEYRALLAHIHAVETVVLLLAKRADAAGVVTDMAEAREAILAAGVYSTGPNGPDYAAQVDFHMQRIESGIRDVAGLPEQGEASSGAQKGR